MYSYLPSIPITAGLDASSKELLEKCMTMSTTMMTELSSMYNTAKEFMLASGPRIAILLLGFFAAKRLVESLASGVVDHMFPKIYKIIVAITGCDDDIEQPVIAQSGDAFIPWESLTAMMLSTVYFWVTGKSSKGLNLKDSLRFISDLPKVTDGVGKLTEAFLKVIKIIFNKVRSLITGETYVDEMTSVFPLVSEFYNKANEIIKSSNDGHYPINAVHYSELNQLLVDGRVILCRSHFGPETQTVLTNVKFLMNCLEKVRAPFLRSTLMADFCRMEPVTILIRGGSGLGKSWMTGPLLRQFMARVLPKDQLEAFSKKPDSFIYNRSPEQAYWDGYRGQFATVFDDLGQCVDVPGNADNEYMSIIRATNIFPYNLHMASLEEKGSTVFSSKVVFCTTNNMSFNNVQSIHHKAALYRRFDMVIDVAVNPERDEHGNYKYGMVRSGSDELKMRNDLEYTDEAWIFHHKIDVTVDGEGRTAYSYSFNELLDELTNIYGDKLNSFHSMNRATNLNLREELLSRSPDLELDEIDDEYFDAPEAPVVKASTQTIAERAYSTSHKVATKFKTFYLEKYDHCSQLIDYVLFKTKLGYNLCWDTVEAYLDSLRVHKAALYEDLLKKAKEAIIKSPGFFEKYCSSISRNFSDVVETFRVNMEVLLTKLATDYPLLSICGVIGSFVGVYLTISNLFAPIAESEPNLSKKEKRLLKKSKERDGEEEKWHARMETLRDLAMTDHIQGQSSVPIPADILVRANSILTRNFLLFRFPGSTDKSGAILMIAGSIGIMPHHYFGELRHMIENGRYLKSDIVEILTPGGDVLKETSVLDFCNCVRYKFDDKDLALIELPGNMRCFANILPHIATKSRMSDISAAKARVLIAEEDQFLEEHEITVTFSAPILTYATNTGRTIKTIESYQYAIDSKSGDCGSCAFFSDTRRSNLGMIFGMHVAGQRSLVGQHYGYGVCFSREEISNAIDNLGSAKLSAQGPPVNDSPLLKHTLPSDLFSGDFIELGVVHKKPGRVSKTALVPIPHLFECFGPTKKIPATLGSCVYEGVRFDPMKRSITKYSGTTPWLPTGVFRTAAIYYYKYLLTVSKVDVDKEILSYEEAVMGRPGVDYFEAINRNTSPGYPLVLDRPGEYKGKHYWLGEDEEFNFHTPQGKQLRSEVLTIVEKASKGIRSLHIYTDCLKDETRPIDKARAGKTRLISAAPLPYVIAVRMYFLAFSRWMMLNRVHNGVAVGVNPYSRDWDAMVHKLKQKGKNMLAGDFSAWDSTMFSEVGQHIVNMINEWYDDGPVNATIREVLFMEMYSSVHLFRDVLYAWHKGMPSGNPLTSLLNSIYNNLVVRACYMFLHQSLDSIEGFDQNVYICAYGDDNVISVSDAVKDVFNMESLTHTFAEIGMTYTDDNKDGETTRFRTIGEITFLKRSFVYNERFNKWLAPLDYTSLEHQLYYCRDMDRVVEIVQQSYSMLLTELSLHGKEVFDKTVKIVAPIIKEHYEFVAPSTDSEYYLEGSLRAEFWY